MLALLTTVKLIPFKYQVICFQTWAEFYKKEDNPLLSLNSTKKKGYTKKTRYLRSETTAESMHVEVGRVCATQGV